MKTLEHPLPLSQPWSDRFRTPSADELLNCLPRIPRAATETARQRLASSATLQEHLRWQGIWRWSFAYEGPQASKPEAYVIPDPRLPRICIPLDAAAANRVFSQPSPGFVREVVERCAAVAGVRWVTWDIESKAMVVELLDTLRPGR